MSDPDMELTWVSSALQSTPTKKEFTKENIIWRSVLLNWKFGKKDVIFDIQWIG